MNEILENYASRRIQTLNELAAHCGEVVWLVSQDGVGANDVILYGDTSVRPWRVGGFAKYNRSKGLKPFWPRVPVAGTQEVFCAGLPTSYQSRFQTVTPRPDQVEAFRVRSYNIPPYMESKTDRLAINFAIFETEHDATTYRTAVALAFRRRRKFVYPYNHTDQHRFRYSFFQRRFFLMGSDVAQQGEENAETVTRVLKGQSPAF